MYGVSIRLICDSIPEPVEFHLGLGKPLQLITLTVRSGGLRYSATRPLIRAVRDITQKKTKSKRENSSITPDGTSQKGISKNLKNGSQIRARKRLPERNIGPRQYHI